MERVMVKVNIGVFDKMLQEAINNKTCPEALKIVLQSELNNTSRIMKYVYKGVIDNQIQVDATLFSAVADLQAD